MYSQKQVKVCIPIPNIFSFLKYWVTVELLGKIYLYTIQCINIFIFPLIGALYPGVMVLFCKWVHMLTRMPFSQRPTSCLPIESQNTYNLTLEWLWPWDDHDIIYDLDLRTSQTKLNWGPGSKITIFHGMTLNLTQWPWYSNWPRYGQDVTSYQKWSFYVNFFKSYSLNRHTNTDRQNKQTDKQTWQKY